MLTPEAIETVELERVKLGGYDRDRTDELLRRIAWDFRRLLQERSVLEEEVRRLERELAKIERREVLQASMLRPTRTLARELREAARQEAALIVKKARERAAAIEADAERKSAGRLAELQRFEKLTGMVRMELRAFLTSVLEAVDGPAPPAEAPAAEEPSVLARDLAELARGGAPASAAAGHPNG